MKCSFTYRVKNICHVQTEINIFLKKKTKWRCAKNTKELSICHKLITTHIFAIQLCKPLIFQTMIIWSNTINSLKCQKFTTLGCKDKGIRISEFVAKTQILLQKIWWIIWIKLIFAKELQYAYRLQKTLFNKIRIRGEKSVSLHFKSPRV